MNLYSRVDNFVRSWLILVVLFADIHLLARRPRVVVFVQNIERDVSTLRHDFRRNLVVEIPRDPTASDRVR